MTEPRVNLEELKALEAGMAPGPWCEAWLYQAVRHVDRNCDLECFSHDLGSAPEAGPCLRFERYDGTALAQLRNALPALIAEVEASRAEKFALEKWILKLSELSNKVQTEANTLRAENEALRAIAAAADRMAMAYAGEMAAMGAGVGIVGFPLLAAYQALSVLLIDRASQSVGADATHEQVIGGGR